MCECQVISVVYMNTFQKTKREKKKKKGSICSILLASDKEIHSGLKPLLR